MIDHLVNFELQPYPIIGTHLAMDRKEIKQTTAMQERIPFQEDVNTAFFFPGGQRRELVDDILAALGGGVTFLSLTGEEGTGKTMICRMVEQEISSNSLCVYVPENIESFDDVLGVIMQSVLGRHGESNEEIALQEREILDFLKKEEWRLVVIFDHAEKMYLAMLERLRKLLDRMNDEKVYLQIILSGRKLLYENLEQLEIIEFAEIEEVHFHLSALEMAETHAYLNHCAKMRSRELGKCMFSSDAARKIYVNAQGSLKATNLLATKAIESADAEESFVVRPRNIIATDAPGLGPGGRGVFLGALSSRKWRWGGVLGTAVAALIVTFFYFTADEESGKERGGLVESSKSFEISTPSDSENFTAVTTEQAQHLSTEEKEALDKSYSERKESLFVVKKAKRDPDIYVEEETTTPPVAMIKGDENAATAGREENRLVGDTQQAALPVELQDGNTLKSLSVHIANGKKKDDKLSESAGAGSSVKAQEQLNRAKKGYLTQLTDEEQADGGGTLALSQSSFNRPTSLPDQTTDGPLDEFIVEDKTKVLTEKNKKAPVGPADISKPKALYRIAPVNFSSKNRSYIAQNPQEIAADDLYQQRLSAGRMLFGEERQELQTIQLMALTAGQAERNLQSRFALPEYQAIAEKLYIVLSKDKSKVFVYYGHYPNEAAAQQARKMLPSFLLENSPYVLSLNDARRKTNFYQ